MHLVNWGEGLSQFCPRGSHNLLFVTGNSHPQQHNNSIEDALAKVSWNVMPYLTQIANGIFIWWSSHYFKNILLLTFHTAAETSSQTFTSHLVHIGPSLCCLYPRKQLVCCQLICFLPLVSYREGSYLLAGKGDKVGGLFNNGREMPFFHLRHTCKHMALCLSFCLFV